MSDNNTIILTSDDEFTHIYNILKQYVKTYKIDDNDIKTNEKQFSFMFYMFYYSDKDKYEVKFYFKDENVFNWIKNQFIYHYSKNIKSNMNKLVYKLKLHEATKFLEFLANICFDDQQNRNTNYVLVLTDGEEPKLAIEKIFNPFDSFFNPFYSSQKPNSKNQFLEFKHENVANKALEIINEYIKFNFITIYQIKKILDSKKNVELPDKQFGELMITKIQNKRECEAMIKNIGNIIHYTKLIMKS